VAAPLVLGACGGLSEAMTAHTDVVARAAGKELKVETVAKMLAANQQIPADPQYVKAVAGAWVDYTLLATAVADDSLLTALDLDRFTAPAREQALVMKLREKVIHPDTTFTPQEVEEQWKTEGPGVELHARHILFKVPAEATPAQRDSVKQLAESVRQRAAAGEDFAALARQYSEDPGSAQRGGDLGYFSRGRMVAPFEEAAFKLKEGEVSPVVESPFGYHVIQALDRRQPELAGQREEFHRFLVQRAEQQAEQAYLDSLARNANIEIQPGGLDVAREIARRPEAPLKGRAADREITTYDKGAFTAGEFLDFVRTQQPEALSAFITAPDEQLQTYMEQLTRKEILIQQARASGVSLTKAEEDSIRVRTRRALQQLLQQTQLAEIAGKRPSPAVIEQRVDSLIADAVVGKVNLVPLGRLGFALRDLYPAEINEGTFGQVVERVQQLRPNPTPAAAPGGAPGVQAPAEAATPPADTAR
jgi:parvulin-like peptidyl-prolyl isomerase